MKIINLFWIKAKRAVGNDGPFLFTRRKTPDTDTWRKALGTGLKHNYQTKQ